MRVKESFGILEKVEKEGKTILLGFNVLYSDVFAVIHLVFQNIGLIFKGSI